MSAVCIGNSHLGALIEAAIADSQAGSRHSYNFAFVLLHREVFQPAIVNSKAGPRLNHTLQKALLDACSDEIGGEAFSRVVFAGARSSPSAIFSLIGGNAHNIIGLLRHEEPFDFVLAERPDLPLDDATRVISESEIYDIMQLSVHNEMEGIFKAMHAELHHPLFHLESPPPIKSSEHIIANLDPFFTGSNRNGVSSAALRYKLWRIHSRVVRELCERWGFNFIPHPIDAVDEEGFLRHEFTPSNATHANVIYGGLLVAQIQSYMENVVACKPKVHPNPYLRQGPTAFWKEAVASVEPSQLSPTANFSFRINKNDRVATAGSCFAQHISRHLQSNGFNYYVAERPHPLMAADLSERYNYGVFSARYGNIYSSRQFLQLLQRAEKEFEPVDQFWTSANGEGFIDPYRPAIQPTAFTSLRALQEDRTRHLKAVSDMIRSLDVLVFTLGLTECWINKADGAAYPLCPGTSGGTFDPEQHLFVNLTVSEVRDDLLAAFGILHRVNPAARVILTVSPVPLKATASQDHVLSATTYSKSVLRAAAGEVSFLSDRIVYFPSYEIITGSYSRGRYFSENLRDVETAGVNHVMRVFQSTLTEVDIDEPQGYTESCKSVEQQTVPPDIRSVAEMICEEEMLEMERLIGIDK